MTKRKATALTPAGKVLARRLLAWDRARVSMRERQGFDVSAYQQRQDLAEISIDATLDSWPEEVRELYQAVLEVTRTPTPAIEIGIGSLRVQVPRLSRLERDAYRAFADEIQVRERLMEVAPRQWADDDGEGD